MLKVTAIPSIIFLCLFISLDQLILNTRNKFLKHTKMYFSLVIFPYLLIGCIVGYLLLYFNCNDVYFYSTIFVVLRMWISIEKYFEVNLNYYLIDFTISTIIVLVAFILFYFDTFSLILYYQIMLLSMSLIIIIKLKIIFYSCNYKLNMFKYSKIHLFYFFKNIKFVPITTVIKNLELLYIPFLNDSQSIVLAKWLKQAVSLILSLNYILSKDFWMTGVLHKFSRMFSFGFCILITAFVVLSFNLINFILYSETMSIINTSLGFLTGFLIYMNYKLMPISVYCFKNRLFNLLFISSIISVSFILSILIFVIYFYKITPNLVTLMIPLSNLINAFVQLLLVKRSIKLKKNCLDIKNYFAF